MTPAFLSTAQVAAALCVSRKSLQNAISLARRGLPAGPLATIPWRRLGRRLLVSSREFSAWCEANIPVKGPQ